MMGIAFPLAKELNNGRVFVFMNKFIYFDWVPVEEVSKEKEIWEEDGYKNNMSYPVFGTNAYKPVDNTRYDHEDDWNIKSWISDEQNLS